MHIQCKLSGRLWLASLASVLLLLGLTTQAQTDIKSGLKAYWNFDGKNFKDAVGIFDGTENGSTPIAFVAGKSGFGQAIQLDGTDQMVEITGGSEDDLAFEGGSMSIAGWFRADVFDKSWQALVAKGEGSSWRVHRRGAEGGFAHAGGVGEGPAGSDITLGEWHHFVAISDVNAANFGTALYIDGAKYTENASTPNLAANGRRMMIGENPDARNRYWNGLVDDVAIWDRPLTEAEIASLYANGTGKPLSVLLGAVVADTDNDGMPDDWERQYGFNINDATDASKDANGNGITNLDEFKRGLDPRDTTKPAVLSALSTGTFDTVRITFSKDLDPATATNAANYTLSPSLAVTAAAYKGKVVTLTTAKQTPGATAYTVTVTGVKDISNFTVPTANNKATFYSYLMTKTGVLKFSYWGNITGTPVDGLYSDPRYPASPDLVAALFSFNSRDAFPDDSHENYGASMEGFLTPTESGNYRFFIYSDDASQLFLSTDDKEANLIQVAEESSCCNFFTEPDSPRTSEPIALVAGRRYFIRHVYKEGGGGDYGQIAWRKEGDKTPAGSLTPIPGKFLSSAVDLPAPAEGSFVTRTPGPNAKNVAPAAQVRIVHNDGKTAWTAANVTLKFDGTAVIPTFTKDAIEATLVYQPSKLLPSKTKHTVTLGYSDPAGKAATLEWTFETTPYSGPVMDTLHSYPGLLLGANQTADKGGRTGQAGDYAIDLTTKGGPVQVTDASFMTAINAATAKDELSVGLWIKKYDIADSSAIWFSSPSQGRVFQAHTPWSNNRVYFDTAGCCDTATQRIDEDIATFADYSGNTDWWKSWRYYVFTKKADAKKIYIDGKLFLEGSNTGPLSTDINRFMIGSDNSVTGGRMHALVDDVAVFSTALSEADIKKIVAGTSPKDIGGVLAYWDFNQVIGAPDTITQGLVAYWNFDGNLQDSVKNFHGTAKGTNALAFVDGLTGFGKAIKLSGTDQYVDITGGNDDELEFPGGSMSIAGWFKVGAFDKSWQALIAKGENQNYRIARRGDGNGIAYAGGVGEGADNVPSVNDGQWHHFVAVSDANTNAFGTALYVDGVLLGIQSAKPVLTANTRHLFIGANPDTSPLRQWNGEIDDIGIWNRVLTADEVATLWNSGQGTPLSTLPLPQPPATIANLTIGKAATGVTITFEGTLQSADAVTGPWADVAGASPQTVTASGTAKFFRSKK